MKAWKIKVAAIVAVILVFIGIGGYWYFSAYTKTPEYAIQQIVRSVEKHDLNTFYRYVDVDHLLDDSYSDLMGGIMDSEEPMNDEARAAVETFTTMLKAPVTASLKTAAEQYVKTGAWSGVAGPHHHGEMLDTEELLEKAGLLHAEFRDVETIRTDTEKGMAEVVLNVYQKDADQIFKIQLLMKKTSEGDWVVSEITNFHTFILEISKVRHMVLEQYLTDLKEVVGKHDKKLRTVQQDLNTVMSAGSLGNQKTRDAMKGIMQGDFMTEWKVRKDEISAFDVPGAAKTLQHLQIKICDFYLDYATAYAKWLDDKNIASLREAEQNLKQAKALEEEADLLENRMRVRVARAK